MLQRINELFRADRSSVARTQSYRPQLEGLEERVVPNAHGGEWIQFDVAGRHDMP
jgi:hypothetical protein